MLTKHTIDFKGKTYGYWTDAVGALVTNCGRQVMIRSESNPDKTPYLREGKTHAAVLAAIKTVTQV